MLWVILTLIAAFLWAGVDITDKFVTEKRIKKPLLLNIIGGCGTFIMLGIIPFFVKGVFSMYMGDIFIAIFVGIIYRVAIFFYYHTILRGEVSIVSPLMSTSPLFVIILSMIIFNERISWIVATGILVVIIGSIILKSDISKRKIHFDITFFLAVVVTFMFAVRTLFLKTITIAGFWNVLFWIGVGQGILSIILLLFNRKLLTAIDKKGVKVILVGVFFNVLALILFTKALSLESASKVATVILTKIIFVFLIALMLSQFFPKILKEDLSRYIIIKKIIGIIVIMGGLYLLI